MTDVRALISELARIEDGPPVVTLYLNTHWNDEQQRERVRIFFHDRSREARQLFGKDTPEGRCVAASLDRLAPVVDELINQDYAPDANGVMLVCSADRDLYEECLVSEELDSAMYVDVQPRLFPLIEMLSRLRPAVLVEVDSGGATIHEWNYGEVVDTRSLERRVPRKHKMGGWSQLKLQNRVEERVRGVWKECAVLLEQIMSDVPDAALILFGQEINVRNFAKLLPTPLQERIVATRPTPPDRLGLLQAVREVVAEERTRNEFDAVHHILRQGLSDRSGVVGLEDTLQAMNERRLRSLALSRRFQAITGFCCTNCDALWTSGAGGCVFCGGATRPVVLREELTRRALASGADVLVVPDGGPLEAYRGVGGLLRHLSGEEHQRLAPVSRVQPSAAPV